MNMVMSVNFSIITIAIIATVALIFGTSAWAASQLSVDSLNCVNNNKEIEITFSWSGFAPSDALEFEVQGDVGKPIATEKLPGTNDGSGSGAIRLENPVYAHKLSLNDRSGDEAWANFNPPNCGESKDKQK